MLGGAFRARPQQAHEAGCHHVRAELYGDGARGGGSHAVQGILPLLVTEGDFPRLLFCGDPRGPLSPFGKAVRRPAKALIAGADGITDEECSNMEIEYISLPKVKGEIC